MATSEKAGKIKEWLGSGSINIFGLPFAGKDTHGRELAKLFDATLIGGGDLFRGHKELHEVKAYIAKGYLAPTDEYLNLVFPFFKQEKLKNRPLILSSVGRWSGEEAPILKAAKRSHHEIKAVVYLEINEEEMRRRWEKSLTIGDRGKRHDDAEHALDTRLKEFRKKTVPVLKFYKSRGLLISIDGIASKEEVSQRIIDGLYKFLSKR